MRLTRRTFLGAAAAAGGGLLLASPWLAACSSGSPVAPGPASAAPPPPRPATPPPAGPGGASREQPAVSTVVLARDPALLGAGGSVQTEGLRRLLFAGLMRLTGAADPAAAWRSLVGPGKRVGLKVNCLAGKGLSTHPELVQAVIDGLTGAGVRPRDILVWDRSDHDLSQAGFRINRQGPGVLTLGTEGAYESRISEAGAVGGCLSRLLTEGCDLLINLPVLKDHDLAGISGGMKNFYGGIHNPNKLHDDGCSPFIADLYSLPAIRDRTVLHVHDLLRPQFEGGPAYVPGNGWPLGGLLLATDPVAADGTAWRILAAERQRRGLKSLEQEGRSPARWLRRAEELGLGRSGPDGVRLVEL
ncbi:MAG: DUF362 domain-containing protein [Myxococcota bacterium]|nr:DUF362 domain-containing protein [Myxococcota bacterium]